MRSQKSGHDSALSKSTDDHLLGVLRGRKGDFWIKGADPDGT